MAGTKQTQQRFACIGLVQLIQIAGKLVALGLHFADEVAAILPLALVGFGQEETAAATEHHIQSLLEGAVVTFAARYQLDGDICLQIPVADMGIGSRRGGVGYPGAGYHTGAAAIGFGQLQQGSHRLAGALAAVALIGGVAVHADDAVVAFDPGHVGRHGGGRVSDLSIVGEGLDKGRLWQGIDGEITLFADTVDAGGRQGV